MHSFSRRHFTLVAAVVVASSAVMMVKATGEDGEGETDPMDADGTLSKPILEQCEQSESPTNGERIHFLFVYVRFILQEFATRSGTALGTFSRGSTPRLATPPPPGFRRGMFAGGTAWTPSLWVRLP